MKRPITSLTFLLAIGLVIGGCATTEAPTPRYPAAEIAAAGYEMKTHDAVIILDASSSMGESTGEWQKFAVAKATTRSIVETMPAGAGINAALRTFGRDAANAGKPSLLAHGMDVFQRGAFLDALAQVTGPGSSTPLGRAIEDAGKDLQRASGNSALIIVTDGKTNAAGAMKAAAALKKALGDRLCIYPVQIGDDTTGRVLLASLAEIGGCGNVASAADLADNQKMAAFVSDVFLGKALVIDSDGDGVPDHLDKCPDTPRGVKVDKDGCPITVLDAQATTWTFDNINFAVGKADIQAESHTVLDEIADALAANPRLKVVVEGHTDSSGRRDLNVDLSQRRAEAVVTYLVGKGVDAGRLSARGYGPDRPVADNATAEGRLKNRRVQFTRVD